MSLWRIFKASLFLPGALGAAADPVIRSDAVPPVVLQGATHRFTATCSGGCSWSLAAGSAGRIDPDGTYHAPSRVTATQSIYGCQLLTPDSPYNARIDTLPVRPESAAWVQKIINAWRPLSLMPFNVAHNAISAGTPSRAFSFLYTRANNGLYQVPAMPDLQLQGGYYASAGDRHYIGVRPDTCEITEIYNAGSNYPSFDIFPVASSGLKYKSLNGALPAHGGVIAAGSYFLAGVLRSQEVMKALATGAGEIPHLINLTLRNYSQLGSNTPDWPATTVATRGTATIPYGARLRLKSSYHYTGSNPVTAILINTMKRYGFMITDGGFSMDAYGLDTDIMPPAMASAIVEIRNLFSARALGNFEFVKQADLAPDTRTGAAGGLMDPRKAAAIPGYVPPEYAQVIVTGATGSASIRVLLQAPAVDFERSMYSFQAGAGGFVLPYHLSGLTDTSATCSISPALGTLDAATCIYTPPAGVAAPTLATVTVTANADSNVKTATNILVLPAGKLGLLLHAPANRTDSAGQKWWAVSPNSPYPLATYGTMLAGVYQDAPTSLPDWYVYGYTYHPRSDTGIDIQVPPGNYKVTARVLGSTRHEWLTLDSQGQLVYPYLDTRSLAGGTVTGASLEMPAVVGADGRLRVYARHTDGYGDPPVRGGDVAVKLPALLIEREDAATPHITVSPAVAPVGVTSRQTQQFTCVGWYMANACTWEVLSGGGTIDSHGLYTAPVTPPDPDVTATVRATSTIDTTKRASATLTRTFGTIALAPSGSSTDRELVTRFSATINGLPYANITWHVSPAVGSIDSSTGVYTAPDSLSADTRVTITAASTDNPAHAGSTTLLIRANPLPIYLAPGMAYLGSGIDRLVDSSGTAWTTAGMNQGHPLYYACTGGQCYGYIFDASHGLPAASTAYPPVAEVTSATARIWQGMVRGSVYAAPPQTDFTYTFPLPNGRYQVALAFNVPVTDARASDYASATQTISINGSPAWVNWSTLANCGVNVACSPAPVAVDVTDHRIQLLFHGTNTSHWPQGSTHYSAPFVNLIRILPEQPVRGSRVRPGADDD